MSRLLLALLFLSACNGPDSSKPKEEIDADDDGYPAEADCDDSNAAINPGAAETCDGMDNNCNLSTDENPTDAGTWYVDVDGDGHGDATRSTVACEAPSGTVASADDCDDNNASIFSGNPEVCDGVDNDCNTIIDDNPTDPSVFYVDADGDGYGDPATAITACLAGAQEVQDGSDCNDADATIHPDAAETDCADPVDYNCDGSTGYADADGDGAAACQDCDDANAARAPELPEICDAADLDEDCDGASDDADPSVSGLTAWYPDGDGDGWAVDGSSILQCEMPTGSSAVIGDCDDTTSAINPGALEVCDPQDTDEDCDGLRDDADPSTDAASWNNFFADLDGDGYGDPANLQPHCELPANASTNSDDCNDGDAAIHPGASERCDATDVDENCNGLADDADTAPLDTNVYYLDADGDGYGGDSTVNACSAPAGAVTNSDDCEDADATISPAAQEICDPNEVDEDCDGQADNADSSATGGTTFYLDTDGDGFGGSTPIVACDLASGYVADSSDCDDSLAAINPDAIEVCDTTRTDENCDGLTDDTDPSVSGKSDWYLDGDGDGYGGSKSISACTQPANTYATNDDCDDAKASINPAATEVCDANDVDENCNGLADDADPGATGQTLRYRDGDGDGYGDPNTSATLCDPPGPSSTDSSDCDDTNASVNPGAVEVCDANDTDENCDGSADDLTATGKFTFYLDSDGDGYGGSSGASVSSCNLPSGYAIGSNDCDDNDKTSYPSATEVCDDGIDQDCSGADQTCASTITRFVALGDAGTGTATQTNVGKAISTICTRDGCDFALYLGDNIYPAGVTSVTDAQFQSKFETPYVALNFPFMVVPGNHDYGGFWDPSRVQYQVDYTAYSSKWYMPDTYYSQVEGDTTFFALDTQAMYAGYGADQTPWMQAELAAAQTTWKIAYGHHPYLSNGPHGNAGDYDGVPGEGQDVENFMDTFFCGQVDVYFCGHDHVLEWLEPKCGVELIVSGAGGSTYGLSGTNPTYFDAATAGFMWVEINGRTFTGVFYDQNGNELFRRSFTK